ncbi:hypothetical protein NL676_020462 [Syzygium grande]|nr:hypothetical protein NL676_020462 [Syzygium grande]
MDILERPLHRHALYKRKLSEQCNPLECNVCSSSIHGSTSIFCCERCNGYLHRSCATGIPSQIQHHPLHAHGLTYFQRNSNSNSQCRACGKRCAVDLYSCELCKVHIHLDSLQLPQTIKSDHHIDELTLPESIVEDDSGEYYCNICERRRDPELWAHYCEQCQLIAHVCSMCSVSVGENPELEDLDEEIEGVQKEEDQMKANLEELMTKLEALKTRRAAVAYE